MKRYLIVAMLLASMTAFAAGGREQKNTNEVTNITWWHSNSGILGEATADLVDTFNNTVGKEKHIHVDAVYQGKASDVLTKAKAIWQGNDLENLPDLVQFDAQAVLDIRDNKALVPMELLAKENGYDLSQIVSSARLSQTYKGQMIGMPFNASTILLYYNKSAFDEVGITEAPKTLDELAEDSKRLLKRDSSGNVTRYGYAGVPTTYELCAWLGQQDGLSLIVDQNNGHDGIPTKVLFDQNGTMVNFLTKWQALHDTGALDNATSGVTGEFASGKTAMMAQSTSALTTMMEMTKGKFELGVANLPMVDEKATGGVNIGGGALYALDNKSGHQDAAFTFVAFAVSMEQQLAWHIATGYFPVNEGTYQMEEFKKHCEEHPLFSVAIDQMRESNPLLQGIWVPSSYEIYYAFQKGIVDMLNNAASPEETTKKLAKTINGYFENYRNTQD